MGTLARVAVGRALPTSGNGFPWVTLVVGRAGSFVLSLVIVAALERAASMPYRRPLMGTGFCRGLTTFSTFGVELDLLARAGHLVTAGLYVAVSLVGAYTTFFHRQFRNHRPWRRVRGRWRPATC